jgi:hypothetical protein
MAVRPGNVGLAERVFAVPISKENRASRKYTRLFSRLTGSRQTTQHSRRVAEDSDEALTHPFGFCEAHRSGDGFKRLSTILHPRTGRLRPQTLDRLGRRHPCCRKKGPTKLSQAQVRDVSQPFDGQLLGQRRALGRRVQVALKPTSKGLGLHRIFIRGKGSKYVIADSTFKRMQVDAWACRLDAGEHHLGIALRTGGAPKCNGWNGGRQVLRLGHDASPRIGGNATLSEDHLAGLHELGGSGAKIRNYRITVSHKEAKMMYSGIDLHSNDSVVAIIDDADHVVAEG